MRKDKFRPINKSNERRNPTDSRARQFYNY